MCFVVVIFTYTAMKAIGQKFTIDIFNMLKYSDTVNTVRAVIKLPKYTYDIRLKQIDTFEIMANERIVARMLAVPRIALISCL